MTRRRRSPWVELSLASGVVLFLVAPAWSEPPTDRLVARADHLITQTSRLLVEVDRLMAGDARAFPEPAPDSGSSGSEEAGGQSSGSAASRALGNELPPTESGADSTAPFLRADRYSGRRNSDGSGRLARADAFIARTAQLMERADRVMALAATGSESYLPLSVESLSPIPPPPNRKTLKVQPALAVMERAPAASVRSMSGTRETDTLLGMADYQDTGTGRDRRLTADQLIAQTVQLMEKADQVIAQADSTKESNGPPSGESTPSVPAPSEGEGPKTVPANGDKNGDTKSPADAQPPSAQPAPAKDQPASDPSKAKPAAAGAAKEPASGAAAPQEEEREVARVPLAAVQAGGLLLPADSLIVEPTVFYTYSQNTRLIVTGFSVLPLIILGTFESERIASNLISPALQFRYGVYRGLQVDFRIPYTYANQSRIRLSTEQAGQVEESQHDSGFGDISFGLTYQFLYERGWLPDLMLRVGASAPTGKSQFDIFREIAEGGGLASAEAFLQALNTKGIALGAGRWNIQAAVNGVKALDPGILFATLGWNYTPASDEDLIQVSATPVTGGIVLEPRLVTAQLGDVHSFAASVGLAISLNNQLSVNFSVSELISKATTANGVKVPGSATNIGTFNFGMNLAISPATTLNFVTSIGVTPDAPNLTLLMSAPMFFNNAAENAYGYVKSTFASLFRRKPAPVEKPVEKPAEPKPAEQPKG